MDRSRIITNVKHIYLRNSQNSLAPETLLIHRLKTFVLTLQITSFQQQSGYF